MTFLSSAFNPLDWESESDGILSQQMGIIPERLYAFNERDQVAQVTL